jgi:GR25 family glycosyltransferase involved in LPS biosynthesis
MPSDLFDKAYVVSSSHLSDRQENTRRVLAAVDWSAEIINGPKAEPGWLSPGISNSIIATGQTHLEAVRRGIQDSCKVIAVFEDDVLLRDDVKELLYQAKSALPIDWEMLYLGATFKQRPEPFAKGLLRVSRAGHMHAYLLSQTGMQRMVQHLERWLADPAGFFDWIAGWNAYIVTPIAAIQRSGQSATHGTYADRETRDYFTYFNRSDFLQHLKVR